MPPSALWPPARRSPLRPGPCGVGVPPGTLLRTLWATDSLLASTPACVSLNSVGLPLGGARTRNEALTRHPAYPAYPAEEMGRLVIVPGEIFSIVRR